MALDHYVHYNGEPSDDLKYQNAIAELRLSLIGNKDLKHKLLRDKLFLRWFHGQLKASLDALTKSEPPTAAVISDLHDRVVILRVLVTFAEKGRTSEDDTAILEACAPLLSRLIQYFTVLFASIFDKSHDTEVESILCDALHILVVFANILKDLAENVSFDSLWKLTTTFLIFSETQKFQHLKLKRVISAGFNTVPFCLDRATPDTALYAEGLLTIALKRLSCEYLHIYNFYFGDFTGAGDPLGSQALPQIVPEKKVLMDNFDLDFITTLTVGASQLLNYLKDNGSRINPSQVEVSFFNSRKVYHCMLLLLKCNNANLLNVASLNLIRFFLAGFLAEPEVDSLIYANYERLFPRIIELLNYDYHSAAVSPIPMFIQLPVSILSDLCLKYPGISMHLRNTNVDLQIMLELEKLFKQVELFRQLNTLKASSEKGTKLADFTTLKSAVDKEASLLQSIQLEVISDYLVLLSVFTSSNEDFRRRITGFESPRFSKTPSPNFLCVMIFEVMDNFRFLVQQMRLSLEVFSQYSLGHQKRDDGKFLSWFGSNIGVIFTLSEHPIYSHILYLTRSLSRSVSTLRTFFVDCNSIQSVFDTDDTPNENGEVAPVYDNIVEIVTSRYNRDTTFKRRGSFVSSLLEILGLLDQVHKITQYFESTKPDYKHHRSASRKAICIKKVILLASIANFILDFSSFRYEIVNHESFLKDLSILYKNAMKSKQEYDAVSTGDDVLRDVAYEHLREQLGVLQVLKNYLYNENEENRKFVWDYIPLSMIFDKSLYGISTPAEQDQELHGLLLLHKIIAFEIMRNLTAASAYFSEAIKGSYEEYLQREVQNGVQIPTSWNEYLLQNIMSYDLFVDSEKDDPENKRFFSDDTFVFSLLQEVDYVRLVVGINYLEDHRYTNVSTFRRSDFPETSLLNVWKRFLGLKLLEKYEAKLCGLNVNKRVRLSNLLIEVKISIDWIMINLTWKDDDYGYQMPDKVNFRLFDTVLNRNNEGNSSSNLFTSSNIVIEESEEEEEEEDDDGAREPGTLEDDSVLSPEERAKLLHKHGFSYALQKLIYDMSTPKLRTKSDKRSALERFDNLNANDLYEKTKTAHMQIVSLVTGVLADGGTPYRAQQHQKKEERHPLRRSSNIISSRDSVQIRRDVNRGGEGFGYGSDEEYLRGEEANDDEAEPAVAEDIEEDEEIDEFWVR